MEIFKVVKKYSKFLCELIFIMIFCILGYIYYSEIYPNYIYKRMILSIFLVILLMNFIYKFKEEKDDIFINKKALLVFAIIYSINILMNLNINILKKVMMHWSLGKVLIIQLIMGMIPIFIGYSFKIKLSNFKWKTSVKWLLISTSIFIIYFIPKIILLGSEAFQYRNYYSKPDYIINIINALIFNVFIEELVYRGYLISGLKALKLNEFIINAIQAIIFGLIHIYQVPNTHIFMGVSWHILMGYILGKLYFKSKSLTPGILLHLLINMV